jgi:hypothetical protein
MPPHAHAPEVAVRQAAERAIAGGDQVEQAHVVHRPGQQPLLAAEAAHARVHRAHQEGVHARAARVHRPVGQQVEERFIGKRDENQRPRALPRGLPRQRAQRVVRALQRRRGGRWLLGERGGRTNAGAHQRQGAR